MATTLEVDEKEHDPGLYDSDTGADCKPEKVVDITDDCPKADKKEPVLLIFTRAKRGRIVQIDRCIHFFVDELADEWNVRSCDDTFGLRARILGLTKFGLRELIEAQAPA